MALIFHITDRSQWQAAKTAGVYRHPSLETEGFIHCSTAQQVVWVANAFFQGQQGLVLLEIETARLQSELRYDPIESGQQFPHVYGPINLESVKQVIDFEPNADGQFELPTAVSAS